MKHAPSEAPATRQARQDQDSLLQLREQLRREQDGTGNGTGACIGKGSSQQGKRAAADAGTGNNQRRKRARQATGQGQKRSAKKRQLSAKKDKYKDKAGKEEG